MNIEEQKRFANKAMTFIRDSISEYSQMGVSRESLRIAFPTYIGDEFLNGLTQLYGHEVNGGLNFSKLNTLLDVSVHPTWENRIRVYCIMIPATFPNGLPTFTLPL